MNQPPRTKVFLEGRYRKLCRDLPQTIFWCPECKGHVRRRHGCARCEGFGKLTRESVQELVAWPAGQVFKTRKHKFHGAGREDIDVRMLGAGRPFVLELLGPKVFDVDLAELEAEINRRNAGRLEILNLHWADKSRVRAVKEQSRAKEYEALVRVEGEVDRARLAAVLDRRVPVVQRTPDRVAHRRADKDRERWVEVLSFEREPESERGAADLWRLRMRTEHGTYVKEVLSGEGGKTRPCLGDLVGARCTCIELDVLEILGEAGDPDPELVPPPAFGSGL